MREKKFGTSSGIEALKLIFKLCGVWPGKWSRCSAILYNAYCINVLVFVLFLYNFSQTIYIFFLEDVAETTYHLSMTLALVLNFLRLLNFKLHLSNIQKLQRDAEEFELENEYEISFLNQHLTQFNKLITFFFATGNIALSANIIGALLDSEVRLPYLGWYPFDWKRNYNLLFAYQTIVMVIQVNLSVGMDLFSAYLMYVGAIKLEVLGMRLEKLSRFREQGPLNMNMDSEAKKKHIAVLVGCVSTYQRIFKYIQQLKKHFTYGYLIQITFIGIILCCIAYQLTIVSPRDDFAFYTYLILFLVGMIVQTFLVCYYGNEVILKHENLTGSIFKCGWHLQSAEYRQIVIIFMELVKKKRSILVGNWFDLDLNLFLSILNFTYRLYTILV